MTVYRNLIKLRMPQHIAANYVPSHTGIDIVYHEFDRDSRTITAELACSDRILPKDIRLDARHISQELDEIQKLDRGKYEILKEGIDRYNYPKSPKFILRTFTFLDDPDVDSDMFHKAKDKSNLIVQDVQYRYLNKRRNSQGLRPIQSRDQVYLPARRTFPKNSPHYKHGDNDLDNKKELHHVFKTGEIERG